MQRRGYYGSELPGRLKGLGLRHGSERMLSKTNSAGAEAHCRLTSGWHSVSMIIAILEIVVIIRLALRIHDNSK